MTYKIKHLAIKRMHYYLLILHDKPSFERERAKLLLAGYLAKILEMKRKNDDKMAAAMPLLHELLYVAKAH